MRVFVLMGNDYPAAVYDEEARAGNTAFRLTQEDIAAAKREGRGRIYWTLHDFELNKDPAG